MKKKENDDLKALYFFLLDTEVLPDKFKGKWVDDKKKFKTFVKQNEEYKTFFN